MIDLPDFGTPLRRIAGSVEKIAGVNRPIWFNSRGKYSYSFDRAPRRLDCASPRMGIGADRLVVPSM